MLAIFEHPAAELEFGSEIPLNKADRKWIEKSIADAVAAVSSRPGSTEPSSVRGLGQSVKAWTNKFGGLVMVLAVAGSLVAILLGGWSAISSRRDEAVRFQQYTTDKFTQIDATLSDIKKMLEAQSAELSAARSAVSQQVFANPASLRSPKSVAEAANQLRAQQVAIPRSTVIGTGQALLKNASLGDPSSWSATNSLLAYISFLNRQTGPVLEDVRDTASNFDTHYQVHAWNFSLAWAGHAIYPNTPELHPLNSPDTNQSQTHGPSYLVMTGGELILDGMVMKHVVLRNVHVTYNGGPIKLQNAYFENCTFTVLPAKNGMLLAKTMLGPSVETNLTLS